VADLVGVEALVVVLHDGRDGVVVGHEGLHDHAAGNDIPPGSSRDLGQELKRALGRTKVGHVEADVGRHHTDERHARKVVTLGHHLGADEDVEFAFAEVAQYAGHEPATARAVAVEPRDACVGESALHLFFEPLGADPEQRRLGCSAPRALFWRRDLMVAVMADQMLFGGVIGERDVAVGATFGVAALEAEDLRRESAAVQEKDDLPALGKRCRHGALQGCREHESAAPGFEGAFAREVDDFDRGQGAFADAV